MTKTEAAEIIANDVRVWARENSQEINISLVSVRVSELMGSAYDGTYKGHAAQLVNQKTALRLALKG